LPGWYYHLQGILLGGLFVGWEFYLGSWLKIGATKLNHQDAQEGCRPSFCGLKILITNIFESSIVQNSWRLNLFEKLAHI